MKSVLLTFVFILSNLFIGMGQNKTALEYANKISARRIKKDVYYLASDLMEGRETGCEGQKLAAQYIYKQFTKAKLKNNSETFDSLGYFQQFKLYKKKPAKARIYFRGKTIENNKDFLLSGYVNYANSNMELLFLGTAELNSYQNKNFTNKAILFLTSNLYAGAHKSNNIATATGAKLILFCKPDNSDQFFQLLQADKNQSPKKLSLKAEQKPVLEHSNLSYKGAISTQAACQILNLKPKDLKKILAKTKTPKNTAAPLYINFNYQLNFDTIATENVIALISGSDQKDEFIVISAHYDHIGKNGDQIFNGANDNASGTASLLELARIFQEAKTNGHPNRKSILFVAFSGEEKGLLGSEYFVQNSKITKKKIKVNLNIDMLGRKDQYHKNTDYIYLLGTNHLKPKLKIISDSINHIRQHTKIDYKYDDPNNYLYMGSDQASFVTNNIPAIFYFNGLHKDYHKVSDTADKLDYKSITDITNLILLTAWQLANQD